MRVRYQVGRVGRGEGAGKMRVRCGRVSGRKNWRWMRGGRIGWSRGELVGRRIGRARGRRCPRGIRGCVRGPGGVCGIAFPGRLELRKEKMLGVSMRFDKY